MTKIYKIPVKYTFEGTFFIEAESKEEAKRMVKENCGCCSPYINSTLSDTEVDWDFNLHPTTEKIGIVSIKN